MYELQSNSSTSTRQQLYYILDQFDGWLLGPSTGLNLGGVKNSHDSMCVTESGRARGVAENIYNSNVHVFWFCAVSGGVTTMAQQTLTTRRLPTPTGDTTTRA